MPFWAPVSANNRFGYIFFIYPLKDYETDLQATLLYKITIQLYNTTLTIPRGAESYDYPGLATLDLLFKERDF